MSRDEDLQGERRQLGAARSRDRFFPSDVVTSAMKNWPAVGQLAEFEAREVVALEELLAALADPGLRVVPAIDLEPAQAPGRRLA